jgi:hypothetical protein
MLSECSATGGGQTARRLDRSRALQTRRDACAHLLQRRGAGFGLSRPRRMDGRRCTMRSAASQGCPTWRVASKW